MKKLSRREFLKRLSLGAAGACAALNAPLSFAQTPGGIIDPPPGAPFKDPAELANAGTTPGVVEVNITAKPAAVHIDGTTARLLTYNGSFPGPTIRVKRGDMLKVRFTNNLPEMGKNVLGYDREVTNLHLSGLRASPEGYSNNSRLLFLSGNTFDSYAFDLAAQAPGTLNFYHPHSHGTAAEQYWGGLAGALVVDDDTDVLAGYETHIMMLKDITLSAGAPEPYTSPGEYLRGKEGDIVMVNGQVNPVLPARPGQVQRWRILNASNARFYHLSLEGHPLHIIGTDGGLLDKPYSVPSMVLSPGERLDILVKAGQAPKNYRLLSMPYNRGGGAGPQITLVTLSVKGSPANDRIPQSINPLAKRPAAVEPAKTRRIVLGIARGRGTVNGISFTYADSHTIESELGTHEVWEIVNESGMDLPFHLQVNSFQVLSLSGGDPGYASFYSRTPAWKDTVLVPGPGSARILVPVTDFTGTAMFHCGILDVADAGVTGSWDIAEREKPDEMSAPEPEENDQEPL
jgi:FtsP/CotA-like multicopper oxidase with cupredoxin domain